VRFLVYLLAPVPLAALSLLGLNAVLALALPQSGAVLSLLGYGYAGFGLQSLLFALAMGWLERRCGLGSRCLLAAILGALAGASLPLLAWMFTGTPPETYFFPVLGAFAGVLATLLASWLPAPATRQVD
jgi:Na+/proline symporter